jgi:uncharacterized membrane protein (UPF0127 family)
MRRFESTSGVWLAGPSGRRVAAWVAEGVGIRLAGLAGLAELPPGRALLLPRCRSVHTVGMRFAIDVAFLSWPPARGRCTVAATRAAVPPFRLATGPRGPRRDTAVLEAEAGTLAAVGLRPGARVRVGEADWAR